MKKYLLIIVCLFSLLFVGCSIDFDSKSYNDDSLIANDMESSSSIGLVSSSSDTGCSFNCASFNGVKSLWKCDSDQSLTINLQIDYSKSAGDAKLVCVDASDNVETILDMSNEADGSASVSKSVQLKEGKNRIKIVGLNVSGLELNISSDDFQTAGGHFTNH